MSLCPVDYKQCCCDPSDGVPCWRVEELKSTIESLRARLDAYESCEVCNPAPPGK